MHSPCGVSPAIRLYFHEAPLVMLTPCAGESGKLLVAASGGERAVRGAAVMNALHSAPINLRRGTPEAVMNSFERTRQRERRAMLERSAEHFRK